LDKKDRLLQIFLEEAGEIIENLDNLMMELEEAEDKADLINNIFRGVHTLKGSANSFGFTRLGEYVHHWEDLLGMFRDDPNSPKLASSIDLFFDAVNVVRDTLELEVQGDTSIPENYNETLEIIKSQLEAKDKKEESISVSTDVITFDSVFEIAPINEKELDQLTPDEKSQVLAKLEEGYNFYNVVLCFDDDLYFRGHNHQISIKLLNGLGDIVKSYWSFNNLATFDKYNTETNYIKDISLYILSAASHEDIDEIFDFVAEEHEVKTRLFTLKEVKEKFDKKVEESKPQEQTTPKIKNEVSKIKVQPQSFIRVESHKIDELFDSVGELVISQSYIDQSVKIKELDDENINKNLQALAKSSKRIQDQVMSLRMVAIKDTFLKMKRVARDVAKKTNKDFEFIIKGEDTEIDKTMVDALSDPLVHLIRNSADHGIESDDIRQSQGKPKGEVSLEAYHSGNNIVIEIKDNGAGIDTNKIFGKAIERGLASPDDNLTQSEIIDFLFNPGFSMAEKITDVSGRGVGLDVVKSSIEKLKGKIIVTSELGKGSSFKIMLPLTLAIIDGMIVSINDEVFILPTLSVIESFPPNMAKINSIHHKEEFIDYRGEVLPIVHLNRVLNLDGTEKAEEDSVFICIDHDKGKFVLRVDALLGRQQVVVKTLGKFLSFIKAIAGGTILGDGNIAFIINIDEIRERLDKSL